MKYYYASPTNEPVGPHSLEDLEVLLTTGKIKSDTLVTAESPEDWKPLDHFLQQAEKPRPQTTKPTDPTAIVYTEKEQKNVFFELSQSSGWSTFLGFIGAICIAVALVSLIGDWSRQEDYDILLPACLTASALTCFFTAYVVNILREICIYQREQYNIAARKALIKNKIYDNEKGA
jgi:hypothetical protein